jgi:hypothetical protein
MTIFWDTLRVSACSLLASLANTLAIKERFSGDERLLSRGKRDFLESKIKELSHKLGITKQIEIKEVTGQQTATAYGCVFLPTVAGILIDPNFASESSEAELEFVLAHELVHIQQNDIPWVLSLMSIAAVITTIALHIFFPTSLALMEGVKTGIFVTVLLVTRVVVAPGREEQADRLGFAICSRAAQKAAPLYFEKERMKNIAMRDYEQSFFSHFTISEEGDDLLSFFHPPLTQRIKYLQDEFRQL